MRIVAYVAKAVQIEHILSHIEEPTQPPTTVAAHTLPDRQDVQESRLDRQTWQLKNWCFCSLVCKIYWSYSKS
jgi:hypothetical protein